MGSKFVFCVCQNNFVHTFSTRVCTLCDSILYNLLFLLRDSSLYYCLKCLSFCLFFLFLCPRCAVISITCCTTWQTCRTCTYIRLQNRVPIPVPIPMIRTHTMSPLHGSHLVLFLLFLLVWCKVISKLCRCLLLMKSK